MNRFSAEDESNLRAEFRHAFHKLSVWEVEFVKHCANGWAEEVGRNINAVSNRVVHAGLQYAARENKTAVISTILEQRPALTSVNFFLESFEKGYMDVFESFKNAHSYAETSLRKIFFKHAGEIIDTALKTQAYDFIEFAFQHFGPGVCNVDVLLDRSMHNNRRAEALKFIEIIKNEHGEWLKSQHNLRRTMLSALIRLDEPEMFHTINFLDGDDFLKRKSADGFINKKSFLNFAVYYSPTILKEFLENYVSPDEDLSWLVTTAYHAQNPASIDIMTSYGADYGHIEFNRDALDGFSDEIYENLQQSLQKEQALNVRVSIDAEFTSLEDLRKEVSNDDGGIEKLMIHMVKANRAIEIADHILKAPSDKMKMSDLQLTDSAGNTVLDVLCRRGQLTVFMNVRLWEDPRAVIEHIKQALPLRYQKIYDEDLRHFENKIKLAEAQSSQTNYTLKRRPPKTL